jgi:hypothetical protein
MEDFLIRLQVTEVDALLYKYREVKREQISGLLLFIDPNDNKHPDRPMICTRSRARGTYNISFLHAATMPHQ